MRSSRLFRFAALVAVVLLSLRVPAFAQEDETNTEDTAPILFQAAARD